MSPAPNPTARTAIAVSPLALAAQAKWAFSTRRVRQDRASQLLADLAQARPGDLVLGRIVRIGFQKRSDDASMSCTWPRRSRRFRLVSNQT